MISLLNSVSTYIERHAGESRNTCEDIHVTHVDCFLKEKPGNFAFRCSVILNSNARRKREYLCIQRAACQLVKESNLEDNSTFRARLAEALVQKGLGH